MRPISSKNKEIINTDPYYKKCVRWKEGTCKGRISIDHTLTYAGRQIDELWNFIPICIYHHAIEQYKAQGDLNRELNVYYALIKATDLELAEYPKADFLIKKQRLIKIYE